jgi:hypothetical protein
MTLWLSLLLYSNLFVLVLVLITLYGIQRERTKFQRTLVNMLELKKRRR